MHSIKFRKSEFYSFRKIAFIHRNCWIVNKFCISWLHLFRLTCLKRTRVTRVTRIRKISTKKKNKEKLHDSSDSDSSIDIPDKNGSKFQCFVTGCRETSVWTSKSSLLNHLNQHVSGHLKGAVSKSFLTAWNLSTCSICCLLISASNKTGYHNNCKKTQDQSQNESGSSYRSSNVVITSASDNSRI